MITLNGGKLYQWDVDRSVSAGVAVNEIHFKDPCGKTALVVEVVDGTAPIPNILLQGLANVVAWAVVGDKTIGTSVFEITPRQKPSDYVYTETEIKNYEALENRIAELETTTVFTWYDNPTAEQNADSVELFKSIIGTDKIYSIGLNVGGETLVCQAYREVNRQIYLTFLDSSPESQLTMYQLIYNKSRETMYFEKSSLLANTFDANSTQGASMKAIAEYISSLSIAGVTPEQISQAVNDYLSKNPIEFKESDPTVPDWAKNPTKPTYTAEEVGAATEKFVEEKIAELPTGGISVGTAEIGQTIKVSAVDENGKPTEWEAVPFPSGGGEWELIGEIKTTEEVSSLVLPVTSGYYRSICGYISAHGTPTNDGKGKNVSVCVNRSYIYGDADTLAMFNNIVLRTSEGDYRHFTFHVDLFNTHSYGSAASVQGYGNTQGSGLGGIYKTFDCYRDMLNVGLTNKRLIESVGLWTNGAFGTHTIVMIWGERV